MSRTSTSGDAESEGGSSQTQNGGVTLTSGTIQNGTLSSSGAFALSAGTVSAALAGTGGVSKTGSGTVTLSGVNTYGGNTSVSAGTLQISGSGTLGATADSTTVSGGIPIFAISTFDTDYVLVQEEFQGVTLNALQEAGHEIWPRDESWRKRIE